MSELSSPLLRVTPSQAGKMAERVRLPPACSIIEHRSSEQLLDQNARLICREHIPHPNAFENAEQETENIEQAPSTASFFPIVSN